MFGALHGGKLCQNDRGQTANYEQLYTSVLCGQEPVEDSCEYGNEQ
jgi:hypothetical protein